MKIVLKIIVRVKLLVYLSSASKQKKHWFKVLLTIVVQIVIVGLEVDLRRKDSQYEIYFDPSLKTFDWHHPEQVLNMFKLPPIL